MIDVTLLGTGSAIPTAKRNHPGTLVKYKAETMLFDCGEGIQRQFRKAKLNPMRLTRLFITHWHGDHILGIPGLLNTLQLNNYEKTLEVYGPKGTKKFMDLMMKIFVHRGKIKINVHEISKGKAIDESDFFVEVFPMEHHTPSIAYRFVEKDKLRINKDKLKKLKLPHTNKIAKLVQGKDVVINGKKVKSKNITYKQLGKKIGIIMDTRLNSNMVKIAKNVDLMICESSFMDLDSKIAKEYYHMTASQAAGIAKKAKAKKLVLIHISQKYTLKEKNLLGEAKKIFKNTILGEDLMNFEV